MREHNDEAEIDSSSGGEGAGGGGGGYIGAGGYIGGGGGGLGSVVTNFVNSLTFVDSLSSADSPLPSPLRGTSFSASFSTSFPSPRELPLLPTSALRGSPQPPREGNQRPGANAHLHLGAEWKRSAQSGVHCGART